MTFNIQCIYLQRTQYHQWQHSCQRRTTHCQPFQRWCHCNRY